MNSNKRVFIGIVCVMLAATSSLYAQEDQRSSGNQVSFGGGAIIAVSDGGISLGPALQVSWVNTGLFTDRLGLGIHPSIMMPIGDEIGLGATLIAGPAMTVFDNGTFRIPITLGLHADYVFAMQVEGRWVWNIGAGTVNLLASDAVELYINNFEYLEDANNRALIIVASGDRDSPSGIINNAGWYSLEAELNITNTINNGTYSSFLVYISKIRINGTECNFSSVMGIGGVIFGKLSSVWGGGGEAQYPDNFPSPINITDSTKAIKTILTVAPDITDCWDGDGKLISGADPYKYITVQGILE
ncbi:MAG: hypothetical protein FWD91_01665 [Treponema sp.]|nr:hypothetical protein [Treponema sp.]